MGISMRSLNKVILIFLSVVSASGSHAWETITRSTPQGQVYAAWNLSSTDPSVSLVVGCIRGQSNATVSINTANFLVGQPNTGMDLIYFAVGQGEHRVGSGSISEAQGRVREDGKGFYFGQGQQGISVTSIIGRNDWLQIYWDFAAPSRSRIMRNIFGNPAREPQKEYLFDTSGFVSATREMARACSW